MTLRDIVARHVALLVEDITELGTFDPEGAHEIRVALVAKLRQLEQFRCLSLQVELP